MLEAALRIAQLSEEHFRRDLAGLLERLSNARELQVLGELTIVEADNCQLLRNANPATVRCAEYAACEEVVVREDRGRPVLRIK